MAKSADNDVVKGSQGERSSLLILQTPPSWVIKFAATSSVTDLANQYVSGWGALLCQGCYLSPVTDRMRRRGSRRSAPR
jgi:hypothetical protein